MKGLLLKDLLSLKGFGKMTVIILVLYIGIALFTGSTAYIASVMVVFCAMLPMTVTALDEQTKWNAYVQSMPVRRDQVVLSKYLLMVLLCGASVALTVVLNIAVSLRFPVDWVDSMLYVGLSVCMLMIMCGITLPILYKFGVEKARLLIMIVFVVCFAAVNYVAGVVDLPALLPSIPLYVVVPLLSLLVFVGSYPITLRIYQAKEY